MAMQRRFASEGKGGIVAANATGYFHNMIGILTESIGNPTPETIPLRLERQLPSGDGVFPVQWGPWHFRQSIDYSMTANRAILDLASRYREDLLFNFWRMGRNSVERGGKDSWTAEPGLIAAGDLRKDFDVLLFVDGAIPAAPRGGAGGPGPRGRDTASVPMEYRSQVGNLSLATTVPHIQAFLEAGGRVVAIGSSALNLTSGLGLPIENQLTEPQPAAAGALVTTDVFFDNSPVFRLLPGAEAKGVRRIAWFTAAEPLKSGWAIGQQYLRDGVAMVSAPVGQGTGYLYGPEILFRAQPQGTFRFLFNVLYGTSGAAKR